MRLEERGYLGIEYLPGRASHYHLTARGQTWGRPSRLGRWLRSPCVHGPRLPLVGRLPWGDQPTSEGPGNLPATATVGRSDILRTLRDHVARRRPTLLVGPPGSGKSHLLRDLAGDGHLYVARVSPFKPCLTELARLLHAEGELQVPGIQASYMDWPDVQSTGTPADASPATRPAQPPTGSGHALVQVRVTHVRALGEVLVVPGDQVTVGHTLARLQGYAEELVEDVALGEVLVAPGDQVTVGHTLARLQGYAEELAGDVALAEAQLAQAQAALDQARRRLVVERERELTAHQEALAEAEESVRTAQRRVAQLERARHRASLRLALAQTRTAYRRRWVEVLEPLAQHDLWNDLPYLVGVTSVDGVKRSDLDYREALARTRFDLQIAQLEQDLAQAELADVIAELEAARQDLARAVDALEKLQAAPIPVSDDDTTVLEAAVRIEELRVARARDALADAVVRSLVAGRVLEVQVERVDGNQATVLIRILTETGGLSNEAESGRDSTGEASHCGRSRKSDEPPGRSATSCISFDPDWGAWRADLSTSGDPSISSIQLFTRAVNPGFVAR